MSERKRDERGAALVAVLVLVTVLSTGLAVTLRLTDTSERATVQLRQQASVAYAADAAGQTAVRQLAADNFNQVAGGCATSGTTEVLPDLYPAVNGAPGASAAVRCTADLGAGGVDPGSANTSPGSALIALAPVGSGEDGIYVSSNAGTAKVRGGIVSASTINAPSGGVENTWTPPASDPTRKTYIVARGACTGTVTVNPAYGTKSCSTGVADPQGRDLDPGTLTPHGGSYDPPSAATTPGTISTCQPSDNYQVVTPGRFTSGAALTAMTGCKKAVVWFKPGVYWFDFADANDANRTWTVEDVYVVAGTPAGGVLNGTPSAAAWPNACVAPGTAGATTSSGAEFVFGGNSRMAVTHQGNPGGQVTVCGSNTSTGNGGGPPIAVYGLKSPVGPVSAQSGCVTTVGGCPVISTDNSPYTTLTVQGTTYLPRARVSIYLNNSTNQVFRWGLVTRSLVVNATGSPSLAQAVVDVPDSALIPVPVPTYYYLDVYVCPGASTCGTTGPVRLRARVKRSSLAPYTFTVLSWSAAR